MERQGVGDLSASAWSPVRSPDEDLSSWTEKMPAIVSLARLWNRYAPRGKGFVPRLLGRALSRSAKYFMRTKRGACLAVEPTSLDVYAYMLNHGRTWDERVFEVCSSMVADRSVFYDVGANVGYMSIEMAALRRDRVTVVAFEPQPALARAIAQSARLNALSAVMVFEVMLGESEGEGELYLAPHSLHASMVAREPRAKRLARTVATVDGMVGSGCIPVPDVIKLDVEGAEWKVLAGARQTIAAVRPGLVFEANENMQRFGHTVRDLLDLVASVAAYDFFVLAGGEDGVIPIEKWSGHDRHVDIVAVPRGIERGKLRGFVQHTGRLNSSS